MVVFYLHLEGFFFIFFMVVSHEMKNAVNEELVKTFRHGGTCNFTFPGSGIHRNNHITQHAGAEFSKSTFPQGKGNHIGGAFAVEVGLVEFGDMGVVHNEDG